MDALQHIKSTKDLIFSLLCGLKYSHLQKLITNMKIYECLNSRVHKHFERLVGYICAYPKVTCTAHIDIAKHIQQAHSIIQIYHSHFRKKIYWGCFIKYQRYHMCHFISYLYIIYYLYIITTKNFHMIDLCVTTPSSAGFASPGTSDVELFPCRTRMWGGATHRS